MHNKKSCQGYIEFKNLIIEVFKYGCKRLNAYCILLNY